jgi:NADPH-dependent 2,4-dienoyl-CoA reductase/sulfur reductase-like enzyme
MMASQAGDGDQGHGMLPQGIDVSVDCLIVGTGPAGGALAALLAHYGSPSVHHRALGGLMGE